MDLKDYLHDHGAMGLAGILGVTPGLISQWKQGVRPIKVERCVEIERVTNRQVMRWDLRPNDWWQIWPELIDHPNAPPIPAESQVVTPSNGFQFGCPVQPQAVREVNHG